MKGNHMSRIVRNIEVAGQRTSFRLEEPFWTAAINCAQETGVSLNQLFTDIVLAHRGPKATMSSAVRTFLICRLRDRALQIERKTGAA
jgi:predicted DNA-binding ribbon-helix-helix protein